MKRMSGFTLLELLISMVLSSFIMLGMMQLYRGVIRYIENSRASMGTNRQVCLLFNQMERDLSTAYIPYLAREEKQEKSAVVASEQKPEAAPKSPEQKTPEEKKLEEKEQEQRKTFFVGTIDDRAEGGKIDGKRFDICKFISFICTNPLQVYEEKRVRLVRVYISLYQINLKVQKSKSVISLFVKRHMICLIR